MWLKCIIFATELKIKELWQTIKTLKTSAATQNVMPTHVEFALFGA